MAHDLRPAKARIVTGPPEAGPFREAWARLRRPHVAAFWRLRSWWLLHRGIVHARRWWNPFGNIVLIISLWTAAAVLIGWAVRGLLVLALHRPDTQAGAGWYWGGFNPDAACAKVGTSCGAITSVVLPVFAAAAAAVVFLAWRLWRVRRYYVHQAKSEPHRLVQTAGRLTNEVVGRDQLCNAIMNNLRDRGTRRPHVVVGRVGTGKTALLVRLTERLADMGAVPVPVRLRDVDKNLDFSQLARERFFAIARAKARSESELDRIWQWLRQKADRIVVLADGLEETLNDPEVVGQRDNLIREAIRKAGEDGLPLVIASRPHEPLRAMQAATTDLEPLSDEASLNFVERAGSWRSDRMILDRVVEGANVAESPLYLQIARDLHRTNLLEPLWRESGAVDPRFQDLWALREDLMEAWLDALLNGAISPELPIDKDTRLAAVEYISALACVGLASNRSEVPLCALEPSVEPEGGSAPAGRDANRRELAEQDGQPTTSGNPGWKARVAEELTARLADLRPPTMLSRTGSRNGNREGAAPRMDVRLAATWCTRMGLVHEQGNAVVFQHSIMQAYLGSRFLPRIVRGTPSGVSPRRAHQERREPAYSVSGSDGRAGPDQVLSRPQGSRELDGIQQTEHIAQALREGGRELLIALTLYSRSLEGRCICRSEKSSLRECPISILRHQLTAEAMELLETAESAVLLNDPRGTEDIEPRHLDERGSLHLQALETYGTAVEIDSVDAHPKQVDLVDAIMMRWQQFGRGEDFDQLREAKLAVVRQCGSAARRVAAQDRDAGYASLFAIGPLESDYRVRVAIAQEVGVGGEHAFHALERQLTEPSWDEPGLLNLIPAVGEQERLPRWDGDLNLDERGRCSRQRRLDEDRLRRERWKADEEVRQETENWHPQTMRAWVLPMLVDSADLTRHHSSPRDDLERWVSEVSGKSGPGSHRTDGQLVPTPRPGQKTALGLALATGFKYAANRRPGVGANQEARAFLVKQAQDLLQQSTFWFTRLTLLQALTLWALPDDITADRPIRGSTAHPQDQVQGWLALEKGRREHPLVKAAAKLAVRALQTRRPERFLWIDEASMATEVGTEVSTPGEQRFHNLWIPPSTGWSTLDPRAQQLLADILLLVSLAERSHRPKDLFSLLERRASLPRLQLPTCLSKDRTRLDPVRAVERGTQPGDKCTADCRMKLCPYPAKAEHLRMEFREVFSLNQRDLLRRWQPRSWLYLRFRREAPWQRRAPIAGLRRFWEQMGERARDTKPEDTTSTGEDDHR